jgi:hypothetical protein
MANNYVSGRFQAFDSNGDPLAGGKLYSYAAGTTTPQATYTTSALTTPNANPVILDSQGRATVWLSDLLRYRMVLKTAADVTITDDDNIQAAPSELSDDSSPTSGAGLVSYNGALDYPADTVGRRLLVFSRTSPINVWDYGVEGNDTVGSLVDETAGMQSAINAAASEKRELILPGTNYLFGALTIPSTMTAMAIRGERGNRPVIYGTQALADAAGTLLAADSYTTLSVTITADILTGQQRITVASTAGLAAGMMIRWTSNSLWYYDNRSQWYKGELHEIGRVIDATTLELDGQTWDTYDISVETVTCVAFTPRRLEMSDLHFKGKTPASDVSTVLLSARALARPWFERIKVENATSTGIAVGHCWHANLYDTEALTMGRGSAVGYGVLDQSSVGTHIDYFKSRGCRRGVDFSSLTGTTLSAPSRKGRISHFDVSGGGTEAYGGNAFEPGGSVPSFGLGGHGCAEDIVIQNGRINSVGQGITVRGRNTTIAGVKFYGKMNQCIRATYGTGLTVRDCEVDYLDFPDKSEDTALAGDSGLPLLQPDYFVVFGNNAGASDWIYRGGVNITSVKATGLRLGFVYFNQTNEITDFDCRNNTVIARPEAAGTFNFFSASGALNVSDSVLGPNTLRRLAGSGTINYVDSNLSIGFRTSDTSFVDLGNGRFRTIIPDDSYTIIRFSTLPSARAIVSLSATSDDTVRGVFQVTGADATLDAFGTIGTNVNGSAVALAGTTGTDGKFTVHLATTGALYLENRMGGSRTIDVHVA